jgi:lysyl-tRNA synthetase class 2
MDMTLYLRIADELYLKRLVIGGMERVYELGKSFRNEGVDRTHNPEFTICELYQAYTDYYGMMEIAENLLVRLVHTTTGGHTLTYNGVETTIRSPFHRIGFFEAIEKYSGIDASYASDDELHAALRTKGVSVEKSANRGQLLDEMFSTFAEPNLIEPTFVVNYPVIISRLPREWMMTLRLSNALSYTGMEWK